MTRLKLWSMWVVAMVVVLNAVLVMGCGGQLPPIIIPTPPPASPCPPPPSPCPECPAPPVCPETPPTCEGVTCYLPNHECKIINEQPTCVPVEPPDPPDPPSPPPPSPPPVEDCSKYIPYQTAFNPLTCTLKGKQTCGTPTDKACGCNGDECSFEVGEDWACHLDSTQRYRATPQTPNWKNGATSGHSEYPPGSKCGGTTKWTFPSGIEARLDGDFGANVKFPNRGAFDITAGRKEKDGLETTKTARVK